MNYFRELYNEGFNETHEGKQEQEILSTGNKTTIKMQELKEAMKKMKLRKAEGHDDIKPEMLKYMGKQRMRRTTSKNF